MKYEYRSIDTRTIQGIRAGERLQRAGWYIIRLGLYTIMFERVKL